MDTCMYKHVQLYRSASAAGWLTASQQQTLLPTVADGHRQPYVLYSSMMLIQSTISSDTHPSIFEFILNDWQTTRTDHLPLDFEHG